MTPGKMDGLEGWIELRKPASVEEFAISNRRQGGMESLADVIEGSTAWAPKRN